MTSNNLTKDEINNGIYGWGLRSYASDPDSPVAGDDIFDIYSTSSGIGLNKIPYAKW
jgi:hypothetical protein